MVFAIFSALIFFGNTGMPEPVRAAETEPVLSRTRFEGNPFQGVCENVALLRKNDFKRDKDFWEKTIGECRAPVQTLPETGFFRNLLGVMGSFDQNDEEKKRGVEFLHRLGQKVIDNLDFNLKQMELQAQCADREKSSPWFEQKRREAESLLERDKKAGEAELAFYDPSRCESLIQALKKTVVEKGPEFRLSLEMMRYSGAANNSLAKGLRDLFKQTYPGEKIELSEEEKKIAFERKTALEAEITSSMRKSIEENRAKLMELQKRDGLPEALRSPDIQSWYRNWYKDSHDGQRPDHPQARLVWRMEQMARRGGAFDEHYRNFSRILGEAPILVFLEKRDPDDAELRKATQKLMENARRTRADVEKLLGQTKEQKGAFYALSEQERLDALLKLLQNGQALKQLLGERSEDCGIAAGIVSYLAGQETKKSAAVFLGMMGAGILASTVLGPAGVFVGSASFGVTLTGAGVSAAMSTASGAYFVYQDARSAEDASRRVLVYTHQEGESVGGGRPIADTSALLDTRNALAINSAIQLASITASAGGGLYRSFFAENQSKYQTQDVLRHLMASKERGGAGLSENQAKALLRNLGSSDQRAAHEALVKLNELMNVDPKELRFFQTLVKKELLDPQTRSTFLPFSQRLHELRKTPEGEAQARKIFERMESFLEQFRASEINPVSRVDAMRVMLASSEFGVENPDLVLRAAQNVKNWDEGLVGLARAYEQARANLLLPEIQSLAPAQRHQAAFERALRGLGVREKDALQAMMSCALGSSPR